MADAMVAGAINTKGTDMEELTRRLANALNRLRNANGDSVYSLDRFHGTLPPPTPAAEPPRLTPEADGSPRASMSGLLNLASDLAAQADNAENITSRLRSML